MSLRPLRTVWFSQLLRGFERAGLQPYISALRQDGNIILVSTPMFSWVGFSMKSSPIKSIEPFCRKSTCPRITFSLPVEKRLKFFFLKSFRILLLGGLIFQKMSLWPLITVWLSQSSYLKNWKLFRNHESCMRLRITCTSINSVFVVQNK